MLNRLRTVITKLSINSSRLMSHRTNNNNNSNTPPKLPELFYVPKITNWLKTKYRLRLLKKRYDPYFSEGAFIYGTQIALCRITEIISDRQIDDLDELVTSNVKQYIVDYLMKRKMTPLQIDMIRTRPEDIKLMVPLNVKFENYDEEESKKNNRETLCKILLKCLAMKWYKYNDNLKLVLVVIESEFQRKYAYGKEYDWIVGGFDLKQCSMLTGAPSR